MNKTMKTKFAFLMALFLFAVALPSWADPKLPIEYTDVVQLYGSPDSHAPHSLGPNGALIGTKFTGSDGSDIQINDLADYVGVKFVYFSRQTPFNEMEVESLLKPLSPMEDWVKKDDRTWVLPKHHAEADWDGEGKLEVTAN